MRPRNKREREVVSLSQRLPNASRAVLEYIHSKLMPKVAYKSSSKGWCSECGQAFESERMKDGSTEICPHCGAALKVKGSLKRSDTYDDYIAVPMVEKGWQVIRYLYVVKYVRKGEESRYAIFDVCQHWTRPTGEDVVLQLAKTMNSWYSAQPFALLSELSVKKDFSVGMSSGIMVYRKGQILPMYRRMGMTTDFHGLSPADFVRALRRNPFFETLLKKGMYNVMRFVANRPLYYDEIKDALRIAVRYDYRIDDVESYHDYIKACIYCGADIRNPKVACPKDFAESHNLMIERKHRKEQKKLLEERMKENAKYIKEKSKYFDLEFNDKELCLVVLKSIPEFKHEGDTLHHCVFKGSYYGRKDSLILSARIDGNSIETIELSLSSYKVLQCHGDHNQNSEYHQRILDLVNRSIPAIKRVAHKAS